MSESFPKANRLRSKTDFNNLRDGSRKYRDPFLSVFYKENTINRSRVAFSISAKSFNSVQRNSLKRAMREIFRKEKSLLRAVDFLVVVQSKKKELSFTEFRPNIICSFKKFLLNLAQTKS